MIKPEMSPVLTMAPPQIASKPKNRAGKTQLAGPVLAYIDMGTNSFHMIVCQAIPARDHFIIISRLKQATPFFHRCLTARYIDEHAQNSALRILRDMRKAAFERGATSILAVATSAVRESKNGEEVLEKIRQELGIDAKMISGREEARLIFLGVLWSTPKLEGPFGIIDIGGGSTEIIVGDRAGISYAESYKLGAARLSQIYFPKEQYSKQQITKLHKMVHGVIKPAAAHISQQGGFTQLVGTSGTILALAKLDRERTARQTHDLHGWKLPIQRLEKYVHEIEAHLLASTRLPGISSQRWHTVLAGSIVLLETMKALSMKEIMVSSAALREGAVVDQLLQTGWLSASLSHLGNPRADSVYALLNKYHASVEHAEKVAHIAKEIFFQSRGVLHQYPDACENLLWSAAMLHDIGTFISRKGHHKHALYLIRNAGLLGHSEEEVELIAAIARYHRGNEPRESHPEFAAIAPYRRKMVRDLAAILRVAEALDRSHRQLIDNVKLLFETNVKPKRTMFKLSFRGKIDAELWALNEKKSLFESQFQTRLSTGL